MQGKFILLSSIMIILLFTPLGSVNTMTDSSGASVSEIETSIIPDTADKMVVAEKARKEARGHFYENIGQIKNNDVLFYGEFPGGVIGFGESEILLSLDGSEGFVSMFFQEALDVVPQGIEEAKYRTNYFLGDRGTYTDVRGFTGIIYENLYPGISLFYQISENGINYDFETAPYIEMMDVRVEFDGLDSQVIERISSTIECEDGTLANTGVLAFQDDVDNLLFATYLGGANADFGVDIAVSPADFVFVTAKTDSDPFYGLEGINYNDTYGGQWDIYIGKLEADLSGLVFSTYVGGAAQDIPTSIAVQDNGQVYVTGYTNSDDFPIVIPPTPPGTGNEGLNDTERIGSYDGFIFKLDSDGSSALYSAYFGGVDNEYPNDIVIPSFGVVIIVGATQAATNMWIPDTYTGYNTTAGGLYDGFAFRLNTGNTAIQWFTFLGGAGSDTITAAEYISATTDLYLTGRTESPDFPANTTMGPSGGSDCFVVKLDIDGENLQYSTIIGGSLDEGTDVYDKSCIAVDSSGNAYVTGPTKSSDFPTSLNAFNDTAGGVKDVFVIKLDGTGEELLYSSYFGGADNDYPGDIGLDSNNHVYVTGKTSSPTFPLVRGTLSTPVEWSACFLMKLSNLGLEYSVRFGGCAHNMGTGLFIHDDDSIYITGHTQYLKLIRISR